MSSSNNTNNDSNNNNKAQPDYSHLPLVPESILKKRHDLDALKRKREYTHEQRELAKKQKLQYSSGGRNAGKQVFYVKKLETFMSLARQRRNNSIRFRRVSKKGMQKRASDKPQMAVREIPVPTLDDDSTETTSTIVKKEYQCSSVGSNMVFCIRIRDSVGAPPCVRKALSSLRLKQAWDGVFLNYDEETRKTLHLVEPWVVYGKPSRAVVSDLVTRRGYARLEKEPQEENNSNDKKKKGKKQSNNKQQQPHRSFERVALSDNTVIEQALGDEHNILCVPDLVEEIYTVGPAFVAANQFLWPFKLGDSKTEFERKTLKMQTNNRDYYGDKGQAINEFIQEML